MRKIKKSEGITLIALIITVIIMLILAGVSIATITNDGGLFRKTNSAAIEFKKQNLIEVVKTAEQYLKIDNQFDKTKEIDIVSLIGKVKEISDVNDKDYLIYVDEEEQTATIIDKKTGIVIDVWIDENKNVNIEGSIVEDIDDAVKPTIEYTLDPEAGTYAEKVKIILTVKEEKNGITKIQFPDNTEKTYSKEKIVVEEYEVTKNGRYKFTAENGNGRKTTIYVDVKNTMNAANIVMEVKNADNTTSLVPTNNKVNVVISYDENIKIGGQELTNENRFQYSIGENHWQNATVNPITLPVTENITVYARYFDGTNGYKTTSVTIVNIDKEEPNAFDLSAIATTNSITVSGSTTDVGSTGTAQENIGIIGYQFQLKDNNGNILTDWTPIQKTVGDGGTESYTFTNAEHGITQGQTYKVNMRSIDKAGNIREATNKDLSVTTNTVTAAEGKVTITATPTTPTNGNVTVNMSTTETGYTLQYKVGNGSWTKYTQGTTGFTVSENTEVHARLIDSTNQAGNTKTVSIANIDKVAPNAFNLSVTATTNSITVSGNTTDVGSTGTAQGNIGISGYQFQLKNSSGTIITAWTTKQTGTSYTFAGLTQNAGYRVSMKAIDKAGNEREATNKDLSVTTNTVTAAEGKVTITATPTTPTNGNVTVKMSTTETGYTLQYKVGNGSWTKYTQGTTGFTVSENTEVYARLIDSTNQAGNTKTISIANIDKVAPVVSSATASTAWGKTNSITISATDTGSTGTAAGNIGIVGYGVNQSSTVEPTYTTHNGGASLSTTINNITKNGTYYVWIKDKAGNLTNKSVVVSKVDTAAPITATIVSSNVDITTFTLTATGVDAAATGTSGSSGIAKYEFYINNKLEKTVITTAGTATYNVTGKTAGTVYTCKVRVLDTAGNYKDSSEISVKTKVPTTPVATTVKVGDYINYDAGTWTVEDFNKIKNSAGNPTVNNSISLPNAQGQFGGFELGQSRNRNSTELVSDYKPRTAGWRVWSIEGNTVTLISAGHPETYYHEWNSSGYSTASVNILRNRNCSMYENSYAQSGSAHILTGQEATAWYNKQFRTSYTLLDYDWINSTFVWQIFPTAEPISVFENGSYYWLASACDANFLYYVHPSYRYVSSWSDDHGSRAFRSPCPTFSKS